MTSMPNKFSAVIFDLGGVVLGSPLHAIARFEKETDVPAGFVNRHVMDSAPDGAWHRLERGEIQMGPEFYKAFDAECAEKGTQLSSRKMMEEISTETHPRPQMLKAIETLKAKGYKVAALTNNWASQDDTQRIEGDDEERTELKARFDHFIESAKVGLRKPDHRIYDLACKALGIEPAEGVFLDDIGANLKGARAFGLATIKVNDPDEALNELALLLDCPELV